MRPVRVVVCGATFGRNYVAALAREPRRYTLAGILGRGGASSRSAARAAGVPLWTTVEEIPPDVDVAAVVVRAGIVGGQGSELGRALMARGLHVLQEQPAHHDEVAENVREARRHGVSYALADPYPHLPAVRRFLAAAAAARAADAVRFVDAACAVQVAFPLLHVLGGTVGTLRPWAFGEPASAADPDDPLRVLSARIGGVPLTLRVQTEMDAEDPDNGLLRLITVTLGTAGGNLTLLDAHGPVVWSPRLHVPASVRHDGDLDAPDAAHLGHPATTVLDRPAGLTHREVLDEHFPAALVRCLDALVGGGRVTAEPAARTLATCRAWHDLTDRLGYPRLRTRPVTEPRPPDAMTAAVAALEAADGRADTRTGTP